MCSCICFSPYSWLKRQTHNSMLRYACSCCVANYYTACCLVWWLQLVYFSGPYLRVMWGNVVRSVHAMFHSDKGNRLVADKTHRFCAPHRQHKCILVSPLFLKFAIFGINFSCFLSGLKHAIIFVCWEKNTVHKSICRHCCHWHTQPAWPTELAANIEWVSELSES